MESTIMYLDYLDTPIGSLKIQASEKGLTRVVFLNVFNDRNTINSNLITSKCKQQLEEYFSGTRKFFSLPLDQQGTDFQKQVWIALQEIDFGQVASYSDIAEAIINPKAVRAVGAANGRNPIGIIVPCHRIIGRNGTLTGYAGGVERKAWLLKHESSYFSS